MADTREGILARLFAIIKQQEGTTGDKFRTTKRNEALLKNEKLPACVLLDGDERIDLRSTSQSRPTAILPTRQVMRPEVYIILQQTASPREPDLGTRLNTLRRTLCHGFANDAALKALLGSNGSMAYIGCVTDLKSGAGLNGEMRLDFELFYIFNPRD